MSNVQISEELFVRLCRLHLLGDESQTIAVKQGLSDKLESITRRELYGKACRGDEQARREYIDRVGVPEDFRW